MYIIKRLLPRLKVRYTFYSVNTNHLYVKKNLKCVMSSDRLI